MILNRFLLYSFTVVVTILRANQNLEIPEIKLQQPAVAPTANLSKIQKTNPKNLTRSKIYLVNQLRKMNRLLKKNLLDLNLKKIRKNQVVVLEVPLQVLKVLQQVVVIKVRVVNHHLHHLIGTLPQIKVQARVQRPRRKRLQKKKRKRKKKNRNKKKRQERLNR